MFLVPLGASGYARLVRSGGTEQWQYLHTDHLGSSVDFAHPERRTFSYFGSGGSGVSES